MPQASQLAAVKLLVSVRSAAEAIVAVEAGADLIDVKEPRHGSLGAASPEVVSEVLAAVAGARPVSAAQGELTAYGGARLPDGIAFAKVGLAGCAPRNTWTADWSTWKAALPRSAAPVAVVYADWSTAAAPPPRAVLTHAVRSGFRVLLIDTFDKRGPGLTELWSAVELADCVAAARDGDLTIVLAGRVKADQLAALLVHEPDYIAVRGSVCRPDRAGTVAADLIRNLKRSLR